VDRPPRDVATIPTAADSFSGRMRQQHSLFHLSRSSVRPGSNEFTPDRVRVWPKCASVGPEPCASEEGEKWIAWGQGSCCGTYTRGWFDWCCFGCLSLAQGAEQDDSRCASRDCEVGGQQSLNASCSGIDERGSISVHVCRRIALHSIGYPPRRICGSDPQSLADDTPTVCSFPRNALIIYIHKQTSYLSPVYCWSCSTDSR
jgi:hypothetical protein